MNGDIAPLSEESASPSLRLWRERSRDERGVLFSLMLCDLIVSVSVLWWMLMSQRTGQHGVAAVFQFQVRGVRSGDN